MNGTSAKQRPLTIALTGGIASGKTAVSDRFAAMGGAVVDTDVIAREVVAPGSEGLTAVTAEFGPDILRSDGQLDRRVLRERIFNDPEARQALEAITHPRIRQVLESRLTEIQAPYAIVVIPLLLETGWIDRFDRVLVVDTPVQVQQQRLMARDNLSAAGAQRILKAQAGREDRLAIADDVISNNGDLAALDARVAELHRKYCQFASKYD